MSDEQKKRRREWLAFWIVMGALFGFAVFSRVFSSPNTDAPENAVYPSGPFAPLDGGESTRIHFGKDEAVSIAIAEVKKRDGWSSNPSWATVEASKAITWDVTVRRWYRSSVDERLVVVSAVTGKVKEYTDPSDLQ